VCISLFLLCILKGNCKCINVYLVVNISLCTITGIAAIYVIEKLIYSFIMAYQHKEVTLSQ